MESAALFERLDRIALDNINEPQGGPGQKINHSQTVIPGITPLGDVLTGVGERLNSHVVHIRDVDDIVVIHAYAARRDIELTVPTALGTPLAAEISVAVEFHDATFH